MMTLRAFVRPPTLEEWFDELESGWEGPDGSSMSTDRICGVRIGVTSKRHQFSTLPANQHDWMYRQGRRRRLPERYRAAADRLYRDLCLARVRAQLPRYRPMRYVAIPRCHARYVALRTAARFAWTQRAKVRAAKWSDRA